MKFKVAMAAAICLGLLCAYLLSAPSAHAQTTPPSRGGTGIPTIPAYGQVLVGNGTNYTLTATSSLGITATVVASYPLQFLASILSLAFGTTTQNAWSAYNNFTYGINAALASSTNATTTGSFYLTGLNGATGGVAIDANGKVYKAATTTAGTGLTYSGNAFNVNATQALTNISGLTSNGFVVTSGGNGALSVDTTAYTPQTRTLTVNGTTKQITSSAGAQDLSANRTVTLSLPAYVLFPGDFLAVNATTTNATTTGAFYLTGLTASKILQVDANGKVIPLTIGTGLTFDGTTLTGSATGVGTVGTSTLETAGQLGAWGTTNGYPAKLYSVATSSVSITGPFSVPSTIGKLVGGSGSVTYWGLATTSQPTTSQLLTSNGAAGVYGTGTSTLTASNGLTGTFTQVGSGGSLGLATINAGVLGSPVNGAVPTSQATSTLYGVGTNGTVLAEVLGVPTWTATTTFNSPLTYSAGSVSCGTCVTSAVTSITLPQGAFNGGLTFATSTNTTNGITSMVKIVGSGSNLTFSSDQSGTLTVTGGGTGTTTAPVSQVLYGGANGAYASTATTTLGTGTTGLTFSGTPYILGPTAITLGGTLAVANGGTNATSFTTTGNAISWDGTRLITAPLTSAITIPFASTTGLSTGNLFLSTGGFVKSGPNTIFGGNGFNTLFRPDSSGGEIQIQSFAGGTNSVFTDAGKLGVSSTTPWKILSVGSSNAGTFAIATSTSGCASFSSGGELYSTGSACGSGSSFSWPWTPVNVYGTTNQATTSDMQFQGAINASSTIRLKTNLLSANSVGFFDLQRDVQTAGNGYTLARIKAPTGASEEATLSLLNDFDGNNAGINERFVDFYSEHYSDSDQSGIRIFQTGTATLPNAFMFGWKLAAASKDSQNVGGFFPNGGWLLGGPATTTQTANTLLTISSTTAATLLDVKAGVGNSRLSVSGTGFGTTTLSGLTISGSATSTSNVGFNITSGCYALNGVCVGGSAGTNYFTNSGASTYLSTGTTLGIGTTTPYTALGVSGTVVADNYVATTTNQSNFVGGLTVGSISLGTYQLTSVGTNNTTGIGDLGIMGSVNLGTTNNNTIGFQHGQQASGGAVQTTAGWDFVGDSHTNGSQSTSIAFATRNAGSYGERFRINFNGKIGLGTSTPYAQLSINAPAGAQSLFSIGSSTSEILNLKASVNAVFNLGTTSRTGLETSATTTIFMNKIQFEGGDSAGNKRCAFFNGATFTSVAGQCN